MSPYRHGQHELGQNFLVDDTVVATIVDLVARTQGPIVEIGPGGGALTLPLERLGRPLTGVEIDVARVRQLRPRVARTTTLLAQDFLRYRLPPRPHVLVGNLPFHQTTALLRRILHAPHWTDAVLLVQWEVARRRAGVGGATMMTAQWWPWFEFGLGCRVSTSAFLPRPGVDGGIVTIGRRDRPLVPVADRRGYQGFVHRVFTGRGRGLRQVVRTAHPSVPKARLAGWAREHGVDGAALPRDLTTAQWAALFAVVRGGR